MEWKTKIIIGILAIGTVTAGAIIMMPETVQVINNIEKAGGGGAIELNQSVQATKTADNYFVRIISKETTIDRGTIIYEIRNDEDYPIVPELTAEYDYGISKSRVNTRSVQMNYLDTWNETIYKEDVTEITDKNGTKYNVTDYIKTGITEHREEKYGDLRELQPKETAKIKEVIMWKAGFKQNIDWVPSITVNNTKYTKIDWAWFNTNFQNCRNISIVETAHQTRQLEPISMNITGIQLFDGNDITPVDAGCDNGGNAVQFELIKNDTTSAYIVMLVNITADTNQNYSIYYNSSSAMGVSQDTTTVEYMDDFNRPDSENVTSLMGGDWNQTSCESCTVKDKKNIRLSNNSVRLNINTTWDSNIQRRLNALGSANITVAFRETTGPKYTQGWTKFSSTNTSSTDIHDTWLKNATGNLDYYNGAWNTAISSVIKRNTSYGIKWRMNPASNNGTLYLNGTAAKSGVKAATTYPNGISWVVLRSGDRNTENITMDDFYYSIQNLTVYATPLVTQQGNNQTKPVTGGTQACWTKSNITKTIIIPSGCRYNITGLDKIGID